ncbi:Mrp protein [Parvularcula bermudensis HTCC2503]|uniref:Iron-sulfur cluster carrier protein n=1 Tax=Parvularcula bermudensis (strain ATCC BAA-594 / HTCC2503 / KCTC 12087) TaxID=314260 RepID=E0TCS3_PARBH|nr:P-loop NTPase [Parvularcula bermudensis]ADM09862.1 Mrp protein [Parvularcula bermudensis HTCC2503]
MWSKIRDAARWGRLERDLKAVLDDRVPGATVTISPSRVLGDQAATIVLGEGHALTADKIDELSAALNHQAAPQKVTLVAPRHGQPSPSTPHRAPQRDGHRPLPTGPDTPPPGGAGAQPQRPQKSRPGNAARVLAVASGKGGVGKSTIAARLALALATATEDRPAARVGLLDLDIYGPSQPLLFGLEGRKAETREGRLVPLEAGPLALMSIGFLVGDDKALAWRGPMVMGAAKQLLFETAWPEGLDWLVIDTPPGTGDAHLTLLQRAVLDLGLLVTTPSPLALADVRRGASLFRQLGTPLAGLVENMASLDGGPSPLGPSLDENAVDLPILARLPLGSALAEPPLIGKDIAPQAAFHALAAHLIALDPPSGTD